MKILIIEQGFQPRVKSGKMNRSLSFVKALAAEHELSLLCANNDGPPDSTETNRYFKYVWNVSLRDGKTAVSHTNKVANIIDFFKGIPWEIPEYYPSDFDKKLLDVLKYNFDIIFARYIFTGRYLFKNIDRINAVTIIDLDDIETLKLKRMIDAGKYKFKSTYDRFRHMLNYDAFGRYHKNLKLLDKCIVCSEQDKRYIEHKKWSKKVCVIPNSVDVSIYNVIRDLNKTILGNKIILFCGHLSYEPNVDAIEWFVENVFPLIKQKEPAAKLYLVGLRPREQLCNFADNKSIFLFSNVPDVVPHYQDASLVVVPIRIAGGTRIKILEAFACRRPVVSTTVGAEGLEVVNNKHCLIADEPQSFADACVRLFNNFEEAANIVQDAYKFVKEKYDAKIVHQMIRDVFNNVKS